MSAVAANTNARLDIPALIEAKAWAEKAVIGAIVVEGLIDEVPDDLEPGHFHHLSYREAFEAIRNMVEKGLSVTERGLFEWLETEKDEKALGVVDDLRKAFREHTWKTAAERFLERCGIVMFGARQIAAEVERGEAKYRDEKAFAEECARALADIQARLAAPSSSTRVPLFVDGAELLKREYVKPAWLVTGLATRGGVGIIGAEPKSVKTWFALEMALSIATGTKVFGEFYAERGVVQYYFAEDIDRQIGNRARGILASKGTTLPAGTFYAQPRGHFLDITRDEDLAWLVASCRRLPKPDLIVLDPLRDIHSAAEDSSDEMSRVMRRLRLIGELLGGPTVFAVHHTGKFSEATKNRRPGQRLRGSSAIHGSVDAGIYLSGTGGDGTALFTNTVECESKGARSAGKFKLELRITDDENGEALRADWTVSRELKQPAKSAKQAQDEADDEDVFGWVRDLAMKGIVASKTALRGRDDAPVPEARCRRALDRLTDRGGRLRNSDGKVRVPGAE